MNDENLVDGKSTLIQVITWWWPRSGPQWVKLNTIICLKSLQSLLITNWILPNPKVTHWHTFGQIHRALTGEAVIIPQLTKCNVNPSKWHLNYIIMLFYYIQLEWHKVMWSIPSCLSSWIPTQCGKFPMQYRKYTPIAQPWEWDMGCFWWVQNMIYVLLFSLLCYIAISIMLYWKFNNKIRLY